MPLLRKDICADLQGSLQMFKYSVDFSGNLLGDFRASSTNLVFQSILADQGTVMLKFSITQKSCPHHGNFGVLRTFGIGETR